MKTEPDKLEIPNPDCGSVSRRQFIKASAIVGGGIVTGVWGLEALKKYGSLTFAAQTAYGIEPAKFQLVYDKEKCCSCCTCEIICAQFHEGDANPVTKRNKLIVRPLITCIGASALTANVPGYPQPLSKIRFAEYSQYHFCRQCPGPECMMVCPEKAIYVDPKTGARVVDEEKCIGCGSCEEACQWGMIHVYSETEKAIKCDLCGGDPQCAKWCPTGAITVKEV